MNADMFGTLPDGTMYTKRRNLWNKPLQNVVTYKGFECQKQSCGIGQTSARIRIDAFALFGAIGRETHITVSFDYILVVRETGTTNPMCECYPKGYVGGKWFGGLDRLGTRFVQPNPGDWTHKKYTFSFNVDKGAATSLNIYPTCLRDIDADLYIRNIMVTYGDEDYPYTPAPEIDETVVLE